MDWLTFGVIAEWVCVVFFGCIGLGGSVWALGGSVWARLKKKKKKKTEVPPLVHFTSLESAELILDEQKLSCRGSIFAVPASMGRIGIQPLTMWYRLILVIRLTIEYRKTAFPILIPTKALTTFRLVKPIGIYSLFKRLNSHHYAPFRVLNLATARFSEPDQRRARFYIYLPDVLYYLVCFTLTHQVLSLWG
jgi:hypothetical protein